MRKRPLFRDAVALALAFVLPGLVAIVPSASAGAAATPIVTGISPGSNILTMSPDAADAALAGMASAGAKWVRIDVPWFVVQPSAGAWQWGMTDTAIGKALQHNLKVLAILDYAPQWAMKNGQPDPTAFASFATAAVARYGPYGLSTWEIWNEENMNWSWPTVSANAYGKLLKAAYGAIHAMQPGSTVLFGGLGRAPDALTLSQSPSTFMSQVLSRGYARYFDALSFHPYTFTDWPDEPAKFGEPAYMNGFVDMANVYKQLVRYGRGSVKVWATEFGAPTSHDANAVTPQQQADQITRAYNKFSTFAWAGPFFVFNWQDDASLGYGLFDIYGNAKPAYAAFRAISGA